MLGPDFFLRDVAEVAADLIGVHLDVDGVGGVIVEVEAYDQADPLRCWKNSMPQAGAPMSIGATASIGV